MMSDLFRYSGSNKMMLHWALLNFTDCVKFITSPFNQNVRALLLIGGHVLEFNRMFFIQVVQHKFYVFISWSDFWFSRVFYLRGIEVAACKGLRIITEIIQFTSKFLSLCNIPWAAKCVPISVNRIKKDDWLLKWCRNYGKWSNVCERFLFLLKTDQ